jgi:2-polyprenyl-3-methyl-5-hydroxy-6-metoxy-1,4-benzoquinol methylase
MNAPFNYSGIPDGYYDKIAHGSDGIRKFWHFHKFESVLRYVPTDLFGENKNILDIGCFAGTFLGMIPRELFGKQIGVDILPNQISYAQKTYGKTYRNFFEIEDFLQNNTDKFHIITLIEVLEHLGHNQIHDLTNMIKARLLPGGRLILTTPNYFSLWPLLEFFLNRESEVKYEEQHITKFNFFNIDQKLNTILKDSFLELESKTTTHFISPLAAGFNYQLAIKMAQKVPASHWKNPLGCIILSRWKML